MFWKESIAITSIPKDSIREMASYTLIASPPFDGDEPTNPCGADSIV